MKICKWCGKEIKRPYNSQKYHKECYILKHNKELLKRYYKRKNQWDDLSTEEQLEIMNKISKEYLYLGNNQKLNNVNLGKR